MSLDTRKHVTPRLKFHDKPLAATPFKSYRCRVPYGYIMIGAKDDDDALNEAKRSSEFALRENLERWNGTEYEPL